VASLLWQQPSAANEAPAPVGQEAQPPADCCTREAAEAVDNQGAGLRSRVHNESEEAMTVPEPQTSNPVHLAVLPIAIEIDAMVAALPADADLAEIASDLIFELDARCGSRDFIAIFKEALAARRALTELGIKV
jgi:hypothetical protein